jgi:photosystem II stability/assembly factor-like uncharacterized protein
MSIVDESTVWLGTRCYNAFGTQFPYSCAVKTTDGGETWQFDSIPVTGQGFIRSLCAVDSNTCFYVFSNSDFTNSTIWKTGDGGSTWLKKTTTQFTAPGAFCDFYHAFDANEGLAVGDPTQGYYEIQRTTDGGDTWSRVGSDLIPPPLPGEWGFENLYCALGDNVWFASSKPSGNYTWSLRLYKSDDRGQNWTVTPNITDDFGFFDMDFSSAQKGVLVDPEMTTATKYFYRTSDGGDTWIKDSLAGNNDPIVGVSQVEGIDGGFVLGYVNPSTSKSTLVFTPDFFENTIIIDTHVSADPYGVNFKEATNGWISATGAGADTNAILKFNGLFASISDAARAIGTLAIIPNPTSTEAIVKLPMMNEKDDLSLMIYDMSGALRETKQVNSNTGWTKLDASAYGIGVYIVKVAIGNQLIASSKWIVQH